MKKYQSLIIFTLILIFTNACNPTYTKGKESLTKIPIQLHKSDGIVQNVGGTYEMLDGTNQDERIFASQIFYQINKSYKYCSFGWGINGYYGEYNVANKADTSDFFRRYNGTELSFYGASPNLRVALFIPYGEYSKFGFYVLNGKVYEYGKYVDFIDEGVDLHKLVDVSSSYRDVFEINSFINHKMNSNSTVGFEVGFSRIKVFTLSIAYMYKMNNFWISISPATSLGYSFAF